MALYVGGLWRYPVKSLAGEPLSEAVLGQSGIPGDRLVCVRGPEGVRTSRRYYRLLGLRGTLGVDNRPLINGYSWDGPEALALVKTAAGDDAWLEGSPDGEGFDILPLLVATDGAVAAFGRDIRRLRPNILIGGVEGLDEVNWPGAELYVGSQGFRGSQGSRGSLGSQGSRGSLGSQGSQGSQGSGAIVRLDSRRGRCPMTTVDPDTLERDPEVLRDIGRRFGGQLALNADVTRGGTIRVGDSVRLVRRRAS